jgi:hypothetical protein
MPWKLTIRIGELLVTAALAVAIIAAWRAERADRAQLAAELAAAKQSLTQADDRQHTRDSQLLQTLATLAADKRSVTSPAQIIRELPQYLSLPAPITLQSTTQSQSAPKSGTSENNVDPGTANSHSSSKNSPKGQPQTQAVIPAEDLKPLYDFTLDCKACQTKLAAAQGDLTDEKTKTVTLTKERDEAVRTAKGGSLLQRITRAAKWFAIGAAAGAIAARAAH